MGWLQCRDYPFSLTEELESLQSLAIGDCYISRSTGVLIIAMFRSYPGIVQTRGNAIGGHYLTIFILKKVRLSTMEIPYLDRKSTRLNSSHGYISYAVFCLK